MVEPVTSLPELIWPTKNQSVFSSTVQHSDPDVDILHSLWFVAIESVGFDSQQISHRITSLDIAQCIHNILFQMTTENENEYMSLVVGSCASPS